MKKDNHSRNAFTHDNESPKGQWLQWIMKRSVIKFIYFVHRQILRFYDADAYVFDDVRLQKDKAFITDFFNEWTEKRIQDIVSHAADVFFFFLKEDGRYRRLYIVLRNKFILEGRIMALSTIEQEELEKWKGK